MLQHFLKPIKQLGNSYLAGIVTASADDDPSTIATYSVAGATTGFSQLWLLLVSTPLLIAIHRMIARIGDVTRKGLITLIKEHFGRRVAFVCVVILLAVNLLTLTADIIGMAAGFQLLTGENYLYFIIPLIILVWYLVVFDTYSHIIRYFFWVAGVLVAYILAGFLARPDWGLVIKSVFWPSVDFNFTYVLVSLGLLGATFSPFTFIWQTEEEIEERHNVNSVKKTDRAVTLGFIYSSLVAFFIMVSSALVIQGGKVDLLSVKDIAQALTPVAGPWATKLFGLGLIGSGMLAIPILAVSSAYAVAEFFAWPEGLRLAPRRAKGFYALITFGFMFCLAALLFELNPIRAMFFSQVLAGAVTPVLIYFILRLAINPKIMGKFICSRWNMAAGWLALTILSLGDIFLIYYLITQ